MVLVAHLCAVALHMRSAATAANVRYSASPLLMARANRDGDPYAVLGIETSASIAQIKSAYHQLALRTHPDTSNETDTATFQKIAEAYAILSDEQRRAMHDGQRGTTSNNGASSRGVWQHQQQQQWQQRPQPTEQEWEQEYENVRDDQQWTSTPTFSEPARDWLRGRSEDPLGIDSDKWRTMAKADAEQRRRVQAQMEGEADDVALDGEQTLFNAIFVPTAFAAAFCASVIALDAGAPPADVTAIDGEQVQQQQQMLLDE